MLVSITLAFTAACALAACGLARARKGEIEALRRTLEEQVEARTVELSARNVELCLVLDHVDQGLVTIDRAGAFACEPSATFSAWFGRPTRGQSFFEHLAGHAPCFAAAAACAWMQVVDELLPQEVALGQVPTALKIGDRHYQLSFRPMGDGESASFLVVVSDVTAQMERSKMVRERRELLSLFQHMIEDRSQLAEFVDEASALVARLVAVSPAGLARALHTLKGNARSFGLESVAEICHDLESRMAEARRLPTRAELAVLTERWTRLTADLELLGHERGRGIEVSPEQHAALEQAVRGGQSREQLLRMVRALALEPVAPRLHRFAEEARRLGERLGKQTAVMVTDDGVRVEAGSWAPLWAALIHAVRNAVDHGLEGPAERAAAGKPEQGRLWLRARGTDSRVCIEVEDDGRGIDWEGLQGRAAALGSSARSNDEILAALFAGGLSTAREVTEISGRGVGMGALHAAVCELGGKLELRSGERGTLVRMTFHRTVPPVLLCPAVCEELAS